MKRKYALIILGTILILPSFFVIFGHFGSPRAEMERIKFYKVANPAGGQDSVFLAPGKFSFDCQLGYPVNQDTFRNNIWVANVFFSSCKETCPRIMSSMRELQKKYKGDREVKFLSITVDPETDSIARLYKYADSIGAAKGQWYLVTGNLTDIYNFANKQMLFQALKDSNETIVAVHDPRVRVIDGQGRFRGDFPDAYSEKGYVEIIHEIEQLKAERVAGKR